MRGYRNAKTKHIDRNNIYPQIYHMDNWSMQSQKPNAEAQEIQAEHALALGVLG